MNNTSKPQARALTRATISKNDLHHQSNVTQGDQETRRVKGEYQRQDVHFPDPTNLLGRMVEVLPMDVISVYPTTYIQDCKSLYANYKYTLNLLEVVAWNPILGRSHDELYKTATTFYLNFCKSAQENSGLHGSIYKLTHKYLSSLATEDRIALLEIVAQLDFKKLETTYIGAILDQWPHLDVDLGDEQWLSLQRIFKRTEFLNGSRDERIEYLKKYWKPLVVVRCLREALLIGEANHKVDVRYLDIHSLKDVHKTLKQDSMKLRMEWLKTHKATCGDLLSEQKQFRKDVEERLIRLKLEKERPRIQQLFTPTQSGYLDHRKINRFGNELVSWFSRNECLGFETLEPDNQIQRYGLLKYALSVLDPHVRTTFLSFVSEECFCCIVAGQDWFIPSRQSSFYKGIKAVDKDVGREKWHRLKSDLVDADYDEDAGSGKESVFKADLQNQAARHHENSDREHEQMGDTSIKEKDDEVRLVRRKKIDRTDSQRATNQQKDQEREKTADATSAFESGAVPQVSSQTTKITAEINLIRQNPNIKVQSEIAANNTEVLKDKKSNLGYERQNNAVVTQQVFPVSRSSIRIDSGRISVGTLFTRIPRQALFADLDKDQLRKVLVHQSQFAEVIERSYRQMSEDRRQRMTSAGRELSKPSIASTAIKMDTIPVEKERYSELIKVYRNAIGEITSQTTRDSEQIARLYDKEVGGTVTGVAFEKIYKSHIKPAIDRLLKSTMKWAQKMYNANFLKIVGHEEWKTKHDKSAIIEYIALFLTKRVLLYIESENRDWILCGIYDYKLLRKLREFNEVYDFEVRPHEDALKGLNEQIEAHVNLLNDVAFVK